jgi:hypothetical protein
MITRKGYKNAAIDQQLNAEGRPAISGRGTWQPGTIGRLCK